MTLYKQVPVTMLIDMGNYDVARTRLETMIAGIDNILKEHEDIEK
jgi:hypothetical protein